MFSLAVPPIPNLFAKLVVNTFIDDAKLLLLLFAKLEYSLFHSTVFISKASTASLVASISFSS